MKTSLESSINKYIKECENSDWILKESFKFEFANYVNQNVKWGSQSDKKIYEILFKSASAEDIEYTNREIGVRFIVESARHHSGKFIKIEDVRLFRKVRKVTNIETIDWKNKSKAMTFPVLSAWLSTLFPDKIYPVPRTGFDETIKFLFDLKGIEIKKNGMPYILGCQPFMKETESILREYLSEEYYLIEWNKFYKNNPEFNIKPKETLSKIDWIWLAQDFHLFVQRKVLKNYKKEDITINSEIEPVGIEGGLTLAEHVRKEDTIEENITTNSETEPVGIEGGSALAEHIIYERDPDFVKKIKEKAIEENKMLNCEVCDFSFLHTYGEIGAGFIEAHHKKPLSERENKSVTRKEDIALVCSNCHKMLHKRDPIYSIEELRRKIEWKQSN